MTKQTKKQIAIRVQRSVVGFVIPMRAIPALYKQLEQAVEAGGTDEELRAIVAQFPGVTS